MQNYQITKLHSSTSYRNNFPLQNNTKNKTKSHNIRTKANIKSYSRTDGGKITRQNHCRSFQLNKKIYQTAYNKKYPIQL